MKKHVLILGAGFAGLELSSRLAESVADEVRVTLIDQKDGFIFGFSKLDLMFGRKPRSEVQLDYRDLSKPGVEFRQEAITSIDPESKQVSTDASSYEADVLVVALGADYDQAATPGFVEHGLEYYSVPGAERLHGAIEGFDSGRILISILGQPFKCPPAPFEGALLLHDHFTERGIRDDVEIKVSGPMQGPVPITKQVSQQFRTALGERDIEYLPETLVLAIDGGEAQVKNGETLPYDMFIGVPIHRVPEVVEGSAMTEDGWVPVNPANLMTRFTDVYAPGDLAGLPMAKAGVFAEAAARVVADDIAARLHGGELARPYEGAGNCFLEFGGGRVGKVEANFLGGPRPTAELVGPSVELAEDKVAFAAERKQRWFG